MRPRLIVTPGDPDGVGPEIVWKVLSSPAFKKNPRSPYVLCVGARQPFERLGARIEDANAPVLAHDKKGAFVPLKPAPVGGPGYQSGWSIETATKLILKNHADALVTGPISKARLQASGYLYSGHTDFLAKICKARHVTMMLANDHLRISLVTTHIGIGKVPQALSRSSIRRAVLHTAMGLTRYWGIHRPRIAVAALNPHAGEGGLFGLEEIRLISPAIRALQKNPQRQFEVEGPFPADTLFAKHIMTSPKKRYDAVVCMYHDQGLIPVKLLDFPRTVNVTLGLPIIRTSVDHGVAFDIANRGVADPSSMAAAIDLAARFIEARGKIK